MMMMMADDGAILAVMKDKGATSDDDSMTC